MPEPVVILADGTFPQHDIPLRYLRNAGKIVCCDGSARSLIAFGLEPFAIVGDLDSLDDEMIDRYTGRVFRDDNQETNDLTKAVTWCRQSGYTDLVILGATGKREDHTLGNISLIAEYCEFSNVKLITDTGIFIPVNKSCSLETFPGQQVSVFSISPETEVTSEGLKFPLAGMKIRNWWEATLNEATGNQINLRFREGKLIVFLTF